MESTDDQSSWQRPSSFLGKHRMEVVISHLHNRMNLIKEELDELETIGGSSIVCNELISSVESVADPLLPVTIGPAEVSWDRWFRGARNSRNHKRWI
ncbi:guanine nucleotide-binding protein subunit gamma 2-like isoform X1 [Pistacia vera]|uniref:guanine nucleotide-binding protein subunit gamma 2-like isoform X1 n=1 Tax=Pistacia vera TaxID=55513 RepID=UPI0012635230|nr:guanine nucleotide-binding protein subunit gamma 2-like isoform X1 [Pistacia vera]